MSGCNVLNHSVALLVLTLIRARDELLLDRSPDVLMDATDDNAVDDAGGEPTADAIAKAVGCECVDAVGAESDADDEAESDAESVSVVGGADNRDGNGEPITADELLGGTATPPRYSKVRFEDSAVCILRFLSSR
jgi:hypothetical protein